MFCALTRLVCRRVYGCHSSPADEEVRACRRAISLPSLGDARCQARSTSAIDRSGSSWGTGSPYGVSADLFAYQG